MNNLIAIARGAGEIVLTHYNGAEGNRFNAKEDGSPLTLADLASHDFISKALRKLAPDIPLISEEAEIPEYESRRSWPRFWLVDPLDGTKEFIKRNGEFTINIALIENGEPTCGVVYAPAKSALYFGANEQGSWKQLGDAAPERIYSSPADLSVPLNVVESSSHRTEGAFEELKQLKVARQILVGSSLKFCLVADGTADLYVRHAPSMEWDVAAGDCVYRNSARNGRHSSPLRYNKPDLLNQGFIIGL